MAVEITMKQVAATVEEDGTAMCIKTRDREEDPLQVFCLQKPQDVLASKTKLIC